MKSIKQHLDTMKFNDASKSSLRNSRTALTGLELHAGKGLSKITKDDITSYLLFLKEKHTEGTLNIKKHYLKAFFVDNNRAKLVKDIKIKQSKGTLEPHDILSPDDITAMIKATENRRYKAIMAILYETGARVSELIGIRVKDIEETEGGMICTIKNEKTAKRTGIGYRKVPLIMAAGYVRNYLLYVNLNKEDQLFDLNRNSINSTLKRIGRMAGIKKPVSPHKFRHAGATKDVIEGMQESIIRQKYGWTNDSNMISRYIHLNDNAVVEAVFGQDSNGKPIQVETADETIIEALQRQNAEMKNQVDELIHFKDIFEAVAKTLQISPDTLKDMPIESDLR